MNRYQIVAVSLVALMFFAFTSKSVLAYNYSLQQTPIPTVKLCDLLRSPNKYKNRIVRVRTIYNSWFEGSELMPDCTNSYGEVWAYFPEEVYSRSQPDISERLEDVFHRYLVDKTGRPFGQFSSWQTELLLTGRLSFSKKKVYGIHGGFAYLFTVVTVEKIGTPHIHDPETGITTSYISESPKERQARHEKEAASVCESNSLALDKVLTEFQSPDDQITLVASLGSKERSPGMNRLRLTTIRDYFVNCAGVPSYRVIIQEGERSRFEGRVNVYRGSELSKILLAGSEMNICLKPCVSPPNKRSQPTAR